jgi:hypothetical protein
MIDPQQRDKYKQALYELTPNDGKTITNASVRDALRAQFPDDDIAQEDYWDLRNSLIADGKLETARGRGGSVRRVPAEVTIETPSATAMAGAVAPIVTALETREAELYEPFKKAIETGYVPNNDLKPWICENTAAQGRRATGGRWTRPDVTLIAMQTFAYVPDKLFEVITFEIKPNLDTALDGVYEAAAHSAFAHRSYLAFPDSKDYESNPLFDRIRNECERFKLGLILFEDVANWDTYNFEVESQTQDPDPQAVNDFIKIQISERSREEIQRWFR